MARPHPSQNSLTLNLFEVCLNKKTISLHRRPYTKAAFDRYIDEHEHIFFYRFRSDGEEHIYAWERRPTEEIIPSGFELAEITLDSHAPIFKKIIEMGFVARLRDYKYRLYKPRYSSRWEFDIRNERPRQFQGLFLMPVMVFSLRNLYSQRSAQQIIALTARRRYRPVFMWDEEKIKSKKIDTRDWDRNDEGEIIASEKNCRRYLQATGLEDEYDRIHDRLHASTHEYDFLDQSEKSFEQIREELHLPDGLAVEEFLLVSLPNASFQTDRIRKPTYYYHNERTKGGYYDQALRDLRPYSHDLFAGQEIRVLILTPKAYEGSVGEFIVRLRKKLESVFHLGQLQFELLTIAPGEAYMESVQRVDPLTFDVAVVVVSDQDKSLSPEASPYYRTKAKLLNQRLPTQEITIENVRANDQLIEKNVALNIYSKLGGTAWTVERAEKDIDELIIGIGSTVDDEANRIIGFANVFDYNGAYLVGDCSQLSTRDSYSKNLERYLVQALEQAFRKKGLGDGDRVRLLFHLYKPASRRYEIRAIQRVIRRFAKLDIQFGIVHLSYGHNFRIFANSGKKIPRRDTFVQLTTRQALLHLGKQSKVPVLVRLDRRGDYTDVYAATKQVLHFAHLSYRSFVPPNRPVTIKYPGLMARLVSNLRMVPGWDPSVLNRLSDTLWFI